MSIGSSPPIVLLASNSLKEAQPIVYRGVITEEHE